MTFHKAPREMIGTTLYAIEGNFIIAVVVRGAWVFPKFAKILDALTTDIKKIYPKIGLDEMDKYVRQGFFKTVFGEK